MTPGFGLLAVDVWFDTPAFVFLILDLKVPYSCLVLVLAFWFWVAGFGSWFGWFGPPALESWFGTPLLGLLLAWDT